MNLGNEEKTSTVDYDKYKGYNLKRVADALEQKNKILEKMNWNLGFICEICKEKNPEMAERIKKRWNSKS